MWDSGSQTLLVADTFENNYYLSFDHDNNLNNITNVFEIGRYI